MLVALLFSQPWMLLGWGLCALPVLIHLLSRRILRREPWAAMRFLRAALERQARQLRLEAWLLLLLRVLVIALLVLAVAEPRFIASDHFGPPREPVRKIVVLDLSASMGRRVSGERLIDRARGELDRLLADAAPGDSFQLVRIAATAPWTLIRRETFNPDDVHAELARWELTEERGDVAGALAAVQDLLKATPADITPEVVVISDWQQSNWLPESVPAQLQLQQALARIALRSKLRCVHIAGPVEGDLAVTQLIPARPLAIAGRDFDVTATIHNFGRTAVAARLEWWVNGRMVDSNPIEINGQSDRSVPARFSSSGAESLDVEARLLLDDALPVNNRRFLAVPVRSELLVLLVDGRPALRAIDGAAGFLATALAQRGAAHSDAARIPLRVQSLSAAELPNRDLSQVDCVWLCDVARLDDDARRRLEQFVQRGGGLVLSVGEQTLPAEWNDWRDPEGRTVLPVVLHAASDVNEPAGAAVAFAIGAAPHPVIAPFVGNPDAGLATTRTRRRFDASLQEGSRRVLDFSDGRPAIVEWSRGRGTIAVVLTAVDDRWGTWAVWPSFPPLVRELTLYSALGTETQRALTVGSAIQRRLAPAHTQVDATVIDPQGRRATVTPRCSAEECLLQFEATTTAGVYHLECGPPVNRHESVAINLDPAESQPATLDEPQIARALLPKQRFSFGPDALSAPRTATPSSTPNSLPERLMLLALTLWCVEQLLSYRGRWGLAALGGLGLAAGLWLVASFSPWLTVVLLALAAAALVFRRQQTRLPPDNPRGRYGGSAHGPLAARTDRLPG